MYKRHTGIESSEEFYLISSNGVMYSIEEPNFESMGSVNSSMVRYVLPDVGYEDATGETHYEIKDHLGNLRVSYTLEWCATCGAACLDQTVEYRIDYVADYFAYGGIMREYIRLNTEQERFLSTGNERDKLTGWDYRNARYYDSDIGRFLSVDPMTSAAFSWSSYRYAFDNPVLFIDPSGLFEGWYKDEMSGGIYFEDRNAKQDNFDSYGVRYFLGSHGNRWVYLGEKADFFIGDKYYSGDEEGFLNYNLPEFTLKESYTMNRKFGLALEYVDSELSAWSNGVNWLKTGDALLQTAGGFGELAAGVYTGNPYYGIDGAARFTFNSFRAGCYLSHNEKTGDAAPTNLGGFIGKVVDGSNGAHWREVGIMQSSGTVINDMSTFRATGGIYRAILAKKYNDAVLNTYMIGSYMINPPLPIVK